MANKNKNKIVASPDDDQTSEIEVRALLQRMRREKPEIEVDAATFDINDRDAATDGRSHAELKAALAEQTSSVANLDFRLEQFKSKQRGLEEELRARTAICDKLNASVRTLESNLRQAALEKASQEKYGQALAAKLKEQSQAIAKLNSQQKDLESKLTAEELRTEEVQGHVQNVTDLLRQEEHKVSATSEQEHSLQVALATKQESIKQYAERQRTLEQELRTQIEITNSLNSNLEATEKQRELLERRLAERSIEIEASQTETARAQEAFEELNATYIEVQEDLNNRIEKSNELQNSIRDAESRLGDCLRQIADQENERQALQKDLDQKQTNIDKLSASEQELQDLIVTNGESKEALKHTLRDAESRLEEVENDAATLREDKLSLQEALDNAQSGTNELHSKQRDMQDELQVRADQLTNLNSKIQDTESRLSDSLRQVADQDEERQSLQLNLQEQQERAEDFDNLQRDLKEKLKAQEAIADELSFKVRDRESRLESAQQQLTEQDEERKALQIELENKQKSIEQFSNRQRSLEDDLKARAEVADELKAKIRDTESRLDSSLQTIATQTEEQRTLQSELDRKRESVQELSQKSNALGATTKELRGKIQKLESNLVRKERQIASIEKASKKKISQIELLTSKKFARENRELNGLLRTARTEISELRTYIDGRKSEWARLEAGLEKTSNQFTASQSKVQNLTTELGSRNSQLVRSREQYIAASEKLTKQKSQIRKLRAQAKALEHALHNDANKEIARYKTIIEKQSGELSGHSHALEELKADRDKYCRYADSLRMQLQDQAANSKVSIAMREKLEAGLDAANATITNLAEQFRAEQVRTQQLNEMEVSLTEKFEQEVQKIRLELGAAEETIAGHETINEQIVSDLVDNRTFQQALEAQLGEVEQEANKSVAALNAQLEKARQDTDDLERDLHNRDSVITELMQELAKHSSSIEPIEDKVSSLQKIDGFKTANTAQQDDDRERVARQLIGEADGKKLRFPLFKKRLTIGRTGHNDIQLNMQFISRRHAVISTDHGQTRVIDWGSKNGVFVNQEQITEKVLHTGDIVTIGTTDFRYEERSKR